MKTQRERFSSNTESRKLTGSGIRVLCALIAALFVATVGLAQNLDPNIQEVQARAVQALAKYVASGSDRAGELIESYGYKPVNAALWRELPPVRKIEAAYLAAMKASPENPVAAGDHFLALLASDLARKYQSVLFDPVIRHYVQRPPAMLPAFDATAALPAEGSILAPETARAISRLAQYCEGNGFGGTQGALRRYFGLSEAVTNEILRTSTSHADALRRGWQAMPETERVERISNLVDDVEIVYQSARLEKDLQPFRRNRPPSLPINGLEPPIRGRQALPPDPPNGSGPVGRGKTGPKPSGPATPKSGDSAKPKPVSRVTQYREFYNEHYRLAAQRRYGAMAERARGFGGVVLGSPVDAVPALGKLASVSWIGPDRPKLVRGKAAHPTQSRAEPNGGLVFRFVTGTGKSAVVQEFVYGPVALADAFVARSLVYDTVAKLPRWQPGEGIGLVGVAGGPRHFLCGPEHLEWNGNRMKVVMHPALLDTEVGWAALMVDIAAREHSPGRSHLGELLKEGGWTNGDAWIHSWVEARSNRAIKFNDVPMTISAVGERLVVRRAVELSSGERGRAAVSNNGLLQARCFGWGRSGVAGIRNFKSIFQQVLPALTQSSQHFNRLNRFAALLGLFRWCRSQGKTVEGDFWQPARVPTPGSIVESEEGYLALPTYDLATVGKELRNRIDARMKQLIFRLSPAGQAILFRQQVLARQGAELKAPHRLRLAEIREKQVALEARLDELVTAAKEPVRKRYNDLATEADKEMNLWDTRSEAGWSHYRRAEELRKELRQFLRTTFPAYAQEADRLDAAKAAADGDAQGTVELQNQILAETRYSDQLTEILIQVEKPQLLHECRRLRKVKDEVDNSPAAKETRRAAYEKLEGLAKECFPNRNYWETLRFLYEDTLPPS